MKKRALIVFLFLLILSPCVFSNAGVFTGSGFTLQLSNSKSIQMVSEDVTIIPGRGRFLFDGTVPGMDRVEYFCKFQLKNLTDRKVKVKVGFPLDSQFVGQYTDDEDVNELVKQYNFVARTSKNTFHVDYANSDKTKEFRKLFLWEMNFLPRETVELHISYQMPISMTLAMTEKDYQYREYEKEWYQSLSNGMFEMFSYITKTGKSWEGKIEKAQFRVYVKGFEEYLYRRGPLEISKNNEADQINYIPKTCYIYRDIRPVNWVYKKGFIEWEYSEFFPEESLVFKYYFLLGLPNNIQEVRNFIKIRWENQYTKEDLLDLKEILMAYMGIKPRIKRVEEFVKYQVWYNPDEKLKEEGLSQENRAFLMEIDKLISESN